MHVKYYSSWFILWLHSSGMIVLILLGAWGNGINKNLYVGIGMAAVYLLFLTYHRYHVYIEITKDYKLKNKGQRDFSHDEIDIFSIKRIVRARAFPMKKWGSLMGIYIINTEGELKQTNIRETNYDESTLKKILTHLLKINPRIELDPVYESLLAGTLSKRLHNIPSTQTPAEADAELRSKLEIKD